MTPRQQKVFEEERKKELKAEAEKQANDWHVPVQHEAGLALRKALRGMSPFKLLQEDIPLIIKLVENPDYRTSKLFTGAVDLFTHDCMHILLGRGLRVKDEAFVIGYTMGSAKKMKRWRRNLFMFISKFFYPDGYKFREEERFIFNLGVAAGERCPKDLTTVDFRHFLEADLDYIRMELEIDSKLLVHCYAIEKECFPDSEESQRLLDFKLLEDE